MPQNKDLKRLVRARMAETGEKYTQALTHVLAETALEPLPAPWHITGSRAADYELGLLPANHGYHGNRVVRLRSRATIEAPGGFGALMQSIVAARYAGRRVRFSATVRVHEVTGWAGLWLRVDGAMGTLTIDNMQDRPLRGTTARAEAGVVVDVAEQAAQLHFGALLDGSGAMDLTRLCFEEVDETVPVTTTALPEEPQALDFGATSPAC